MPFYTRIWETKSEEDGNADGSGKLIEDAGLKGYRVGGAMVSEKHCGFVINYSNATATDVLQVINDVEKTVKEKFNVTLEPEVKII